MDKLTIDRETRLCMSLSGRPGTFGIRFHNFLYQELGLNFIYKAFTTRDLPAAVAGIRALGIRGCAVSMPFKEACVPLMDSLDPSAASVGAVNTIVNDGGHLHAYNTDYTAVRKLLVEHQISPDTPFALRGSGGMAKAVASALHDQGFRSGTIVARNEITGRALAQTHGFAFSPTLASHPAMLINVTPIGMEGGAEGSDLPFDAEAIAAARVVFDVVAQPPETPLVLAARARGKHVISGAEVLVLQGAEQFVLYTGIRPTDAQVRRAAEFVFSPKASARIVRIDHVQLAMPQGREAEARAFYGDLLGVPEQPKPPELAVRGGVWFERPGLKIHLGVDKDFRPARKAHPALIVEGLPDLVARLVAAGVKVTGDEPMPGYDRVYADDPFGNRIELLEKQSPL